MVAAGVVPLVVQLDQEDLVVVVVVAERISQGLVLHKPVLQVMVTVMQVVLDDGLAIVLVPEMVAEEATVRVRVAAAAAAKAAAQAALAAGSPAPPPAEAGEEVEEA
jgi:hypothetical protein